LYIKKGTKKGELLSMKESLVEISMGTAITISFCCTEIWISYVIDGHAILIKQISVGSSCDDSWQFSVLMMFFTLVFLRG
jgi:hypothetical protein